MKAETVIEVVKKLVGEVDAVELGLKHCGRKTNESSDR